MSSERIDPSQYEKPPAEIREDLEESFAQTRDPQTPPEPGDTPARPEKTRPPIDE